MFEALRDDLDDDWEAFRSTSWVDRDPVQGSDDDEIDFVLCHPRRAIIALEVKGGGIECRHGEWFRLPAGGGPREKMRDPFQVALDHRYELGRLLAAHDGFDRNETGAGRTRRRARARRLEGRGRAVDARPRTCAAPSGWRRTVVRYPRRGVQNPTPSRVREFSHARVDVYSAPTAA